MASKKSSVAFLALGICAAAVMIIILYGASIPTEKKVEEETLTFRTEYRTEDMPADTGLHNLEKSERRQTGIRGKGMARIQQNDEEQGYLLGSREKIASSKPSTGDQIRTKSTTVASPTATTTTTTTTTTTPAPPTLSTKEANMLPETYVQDSSKEELEGITEQGLNQGALSASWDEFFPFPRKPWVESVKEMIHKFRDTAEANAEKYDALSRVFQSMSNDALKIGNSQLEISVDASLLDGTKHEHTFEDSPANCEECEDDIVVEGGPNNFLQKLKYLHQNLSLVNNFLESFKGALVNGSSGIEILKHLNTFYKPNGDQPALGRNAYETSLTAFVFMSFGVFLLKQIETVGEEENNDVLGRNQRGNPNSSPGESSDLSLLFDPPVMNWTVFINSTKLGQNGTQEHQWLVDTNGTMSTRYINSLFRGAANLVNAYTKDTDVLECIWSLYCQELDKTSAKDGLYGIAARINSIGLRLIMDQIPAELTFDVLLRSLLGWDGLPCMEMFPKCRGNKAKIMLQAATSGNSASP